MQFDRTRITIRERGYLEILDLAVAVLRAYVLPLTAVLAVGVVPTMALNAWLLSPLAPTELEPEFPFGYLFCMLLLVLWEAPLATAPATLFFGQALFMERPHPGKLARSFFQSLGQLLLYQVFLRVLLIPWIVTWFLPYAAWPYLSEVILLERNPLSERRRGQMTTFRRTQILHGGFVGDLFGRWLAAAAVGCLLFCSFLLAIAFLRSALLDLGTNSEWYMFWEWDRTMFTWHYPLVLWLVMGYFTVVRFLAYLDLRIRREGWEVELILRAEQARLSRQLT